MQDDYNCISMVWEDGKNTGREVIINFPYGPQEDNNLEYEVKNIMENLVVEKLRSYGGI